MIREWIVDGMGHNDCLHQRYTSRASRQSNGVRAQVSASIVGFSVDCRPPVIGIGISTNTQKYVDRPSRSA